MSDIHRNNLNSFLEKYMQDFMGYHFLFQLTVPLSVISFSFWLAISESLDCRSCHVFYSVILLLNRSVALTIQQ